MPDKPVPTNTAILVQDTLPLTPLSECSLGSTCWITATPAGIWNASINEMDIVIKTNINGESMFCVYTYNIYKTNRTRAISESTNTFFLFIFSTNGPINGWIITEVAWLIPKIIADHPALFVSKYTNHVKSIVSNESPQRLIILEVSR